MCDQDYACDCLVYVMLCNSVKKLGFRGNLKVYLSDNSGFILYHYLLVLKDKLKYFQFVT